jgi:hypothetical protein
MTKAFRHGEISFIKISDLPEGLKQEKSKVIMQGSHNNSHSFDNGKLYFKKVYAYVFGYFIAKNTTLFHPDHGKGKGLKKSKLPNGIYELRKQQEFTPAGLVPIKD